jgi:hypothetical protein
MERQKLFGRRPAPLLSLVIDEHVLRRPRGGREAEPKKVSPLEATYGALRQTR